MGRLYPLAHCLDVQRGILFDTTALFDLFEYEHANSAPSPFLLRIQPARRYTSVINVFEFICNCSSDLVKTRRGWLRDRNIKTLPLTRDVSTTFVSLLGKTVGCYLRNDLLVAATAKREVLAVASRDSDFRDIQGVLCVSEFALPE